MSEQTMNDMLRVALVGNPNCGKTSLFNQLTGTRQKVANYAGVTVERKEGHFSLPSGRNVRVLDLPGAYSLEATSPDEAITRDVCQGVLESEAEQDALLVVIDVTNLKLHLNLLLEVVALQRPMLIVLNMMDEARRRGMQINAQALSEKLGVSVVETVAVRTDGVQNLLNSLDKSDFKVPTYQVLSSIHDSINELIGVTVTSAVQEDSRTTFLDKLFLHPVLGLLSLAVLMFVVFQAVFAWAGPFMDAIETFFGWLGEVIGANISHPLLQSLVVDGIIGGAGGVVVFLPQILILFFFILILEESGYLPRAAFLLDKLMLKQV